MRSLQIAVAGTAVIFVAAACSPTRQESGRDRPIEVRVGERTVGFSRLHPGVTHTQVPLEWDQAPQSLKAEIYNSGFYQNQNIMGWGAGNPEPSPGLFDWHSLDERIELFGKTGGTTVLTLCCAPDWMKGGQPGETDWKRLNEAPLPEHYGDFAALAGQVARRYPQVKHYQVWHGLKGFYDRKLRRWNFEGYTQLYNQVYRELKAANPEIQVGGPYAAMNSWSSSARASNPSKVAGPWGVLDQRDLDAVDYWLRNKEGADFITLDMSSPNRDFAAPAGLSKSTGKIAAITKWVRQETDLPIWAAKWSVLPREGQQPGLLQQSSLLATGFAEMIRSGVEVGLLWEPQGRGDNCRGCLWNDTRLPGGGQPNVSMAALDSLASTFPPGTPLLDTRVSNPSVSALSSPTLTVVINHSLQRKVVRINGSSHRMDPFEMRIFLRAQPSRS